MWCFSMKYSLSDSEIVPKQIALACYVRAFNYSIPKKWRNNAKVLYEITIFIVHFNAYHLSTYIKSAFKM